VSGDLEPILDAIGKVPWLSRLGARIEQDELMPAFGLPAWPAAHDPCGGCARSTIGQAPKIRHRRR
jgi:hypothetical protein